MSFGFELNDWILRRRRERKLMEEHWNVIKRDQQERNRQEK
jgi:hypothetical protein